MVLGLLCLSSCNEDTVDIPDELVGEPFCMIVTGSWGHFEDGSKQLILWEGPHLSPAGCACIDRDERWEPDVGAMLAELAYQDCEAAAKQWDFVWNECLEDYEAGVWLNTIWWVGEGSDSTQFRPADLHCVEP
jgi:hypothetical protein